MAPEAAQGIDFKTDASLKEPLLVAALTGSEAISSPYEFRLDFISKQTDDSKVLETVKKFGGGGRQAEIGQAAAKTKNLVPGKYQLADTSGLKQTVKAGPNTINFDLTD